MEANMVKMLLKAASVLLQIHSHAWCDLCFAIHTDSWTRKASAAVTGPSLGLAPEWLFNFHYLEPSSLGD